LDMKCLLKGSSVAKAQFPADGALERWLDYEEANFISRLIADEFIADQAIRKWGLVLRKIGCWGCALEGSFLFHPLPLALDGVAFLHPALLPVIPCLVTGP
jgi:hypothetical protein